MNTLVEHIQNVFESRCRTNERYSLRAFARSLEMPPSSLSEILNQKRPITKKLSDKIGKALNLSTEQIKALNSEKTVDNYEQLALDSFYIISEWYHYGVLQLLKTKSFKNDSKWIAGRLGVSPAQIMLALERLKRVGIIKEKNGKLVDVTNGNTSHLVNNFTSAQLRQFQIEALQKGIDALRSVPISLRDNTSMTFAMNKEAIPFAKEEIKKFRRKLTKKLEAYGEPDEVYQMALSLTPLTIIENHGEKNDLH
jgi:uncharacterized protein (TIGR02147 family)